MERIICLGTESALLDCSTEVPIGYANCGYDQMLSMNCQCEWNSIIVVNFYKLKTSYFSAIGGTNCTYGDVRLADYRYSRSEGRVEVCYNGEWGSVCSHGWSGVESTAVCKQLGYDGYASQYSFNYYYNVNQGSIWLTSVACSNSNTSLLSCAYSTDTSDCTHSDDVIIRCYCKCFLVLWPALNSAIILIAKDESHCLNGTVKLWSAYDSTLDNEGIVLVCKDGRWYPMRNNYGNCRELEIVCNSIGYTQLDCELNCDEIKKLCVLIIMVHQCSSLYNKDLYSLQTEGTMVIDIMDTFTLINNMNNLSSKSIRV